MGNTNSMVTNIIVCKITGNPSGSYDDFTASFQIKVDHIKTVIYNRYDKTFRTIKGFKYLDNIEMYVATTNDETAVVWKEYYDTNGTQKGSGTLWNIVGAVLAVCPKTSGYYYGYTELTNGIWDTERTSLGVVKEYEKSRQAQIDYYNHPITAGYFKFDNIKLDEEDQHVIVHVTFNSNVRRPDISRIYTFDAH